MDSVIQDRKAGGKAYGIHFINVFPVTSDPVDGIERNLVGVFYLAKQIIKPCVT